MDKDVLSAFHANKSEPFAIIEPLDSAFALHTALLSSHQPHGPTTHRARPPYLRKPPTNQRNNYVRVCIYHSPLMSVKWVFAAICFAPSHPV